MFARALFVIATVAGCTDSGSAVTGRFIDRFYTPSGIVERPSDLSARGFRVFSQGSWYPASDLTEGAFDGTIYIEGVPDGPYVLNVVYGGGKMSWHQHEDHELVDVTTYVGRPDRQAATTVPMRLQLDGLTPWTPDADVLVANCWENGTEHYPIELQPMLPSGATSVDATFDWAGQTSGWGPYLMSADDTLAISRIATTVRDAINIDKLTQIATGPAPMQRDGEPSGFAGRFVDVPATHAMTFAIDVPAFAARYAMAKRMAWGMSVLKGPSSHALHVFGPALVSVGQFDMFTPKPIQVTETFGDPFDPGWQLIAHAGFSAEIARALPDGSPIIGLGFENAYATRHVEHDGSVAFEAPPRVTSSSLAGRPLAGDIPWDGVSPMPLLVDLPDGANGFSLDAWRIEPGGFPELWTSGSSDSNELVLPNDALRFGDYYLLRVGVSTQTPTASAGSLAVLGPFRLVR